MLGLLFALSRNSLYKPSPKTTQIFDYFYLKSLKNAQTPSLIKIPYRNLIA